MRDNIGGYVASERGAPNPRYIDAVLNYAQDGAQVYRRWVAAGVEVDTFEPEMHHVRVHDGRAMRGALTLDSVGFTFLSHRSAVNDFLDEAEVARLYPAEVDQVVREVTGAQRTAATGWTLRTSNDRERERMMTAEYRGGKGGVQPPGAMVHVDQAPQRAQVMARRLYDKTFAEGPPYSRFISFSFWRPFSEPPHDWPLALFDGTSVAAGDGHLNPIIFGSSVPDEATRMAPITDEASLPAGTVFSFNPDHRWYYFPDMSRDEVALFKFYDSDQNRAWRVPHTAFLDRSTPGTRMRSSVEYRITAYFE
jgi:hypothetical protein